jgi:NAD(P)-dependent dehydrogenase (short-subunit alcohol dehydrogenase family)
MPTLFDLDGRVVVITGGLGQLGRQFASAVVSHGGRAAILDVHKAEDRTLGGLIPVAHMDSALSIVADVTSRTSLEAALERIERHWEAPFGLINNAAIDSPPDAPTGENGPYEDFPEAVFDRVMSVNVKGVHLCCQVFGGAMAKKGRGAIVNVGSIYGVVAPDQSLYGYRRAGGETYFKPAAYAVSKSALYNLTRYLAVYWGRAGVRVNIVTFAGVANNQDPRFVERYLPKVPLGRMAAAAEYNGTIIYLLSEASAYMTGSNIVIDGGFTAL